MRMSTRRFTVRESIDGMIFPLLGLFIISAIVLGLIALDEVVKWKRGGRRPALWHWAVLAIVSIVALSLIALWVGEYRFESKQRPVFQIDPLPNSQQCLSLD
jgi:hypothetical protein